MEISGIYMIKNKTNGKIYVGQSFSIRKRWSTHIRKLQSNKHENFDLQNDFNQYKIESFQFEVIKQMNEATRKELLEEETKYMIELNSIKNGYNKMASLNTETYVNSSRSVSLHQKIEQKGKYYDKSLDEAGVNDVNGLKIFYFLKKIERYGYKIGDYKCMLSTLRDAGIFKQIQVSGRKYNVAEDSYVEQGYFKNIIQETIIRGKNVGEYKIYITAEGEDFMLKKMKEFNLFIEKPNGLNT